MRSEADGLSESTSLAKAIIALSILFVLVGLIGNSFAAYSGANAGWNTLTTTLQTGPTLPSFLNPFDAIYTRENLPTGNGAYKIGPNWTADPPAAKFNNGSVSACSGGDWWGCVSTEDGNESYVYLNPAGDAQFAVNMTPTSDVGQFLVGDFVITVQCEAANPVHTTGFYLYLNVAGGGTLNFFESYSVTCGSSSFVTSSLKTDVSVPHNTTEFDGPWPLLTVTSATGAVLISYIAVTVHYIHRQWCAGGLDGIACGFVNFAYIIGDGVMFFVNGVVFILTTIFAIISFLAAVIGGFFLGIFTATTFFLNVPNIPTFVGAIITALFVGLFAFVVFLVVKVLRGTGSVG